MTIDHIQYGEDVYEIRDRNAETEISTIKSEISTMKTNFQDGCNTIAAAVTAMGVTTAANSSPTIIANNIKKIVTPLSGNAVAADVLLGKTFYSTSAATKITGTMTNRGAVTGSISTSGGNYTIPAGYHNGSGKVTGPTLAGLVGNNVNLNNNAYLLSGYTAYGVNGTKYTGSMTNREIVNSAIGGINSNYPSIPVWDGDALQIGTATVDRKNRLCIRVPEGYWGHNAYVGVETSSLGNAATGNVLQGKTFTSSAGLAVAGTMRNWSGTPQHIDARRLQNNRFEVAVAAGYHGYSWAGNSYEYMEYSEVASTIGLTAAKIVSGNTILGIAGTDKGYNAGYSEGQTAFRNVTAPATGTGAAGVFLDGLITAGNAGIDPVQNPVSVSAGATFSNIMMGLLQKKTEASKDRLKKVIIISLVGAVFGSHPPTLSNVLVNNSKLTYKLLETGELSTFWTYTNSSGSTATLKTRYDIILIDVASLFSNSTDYTCSIEVDYINTYTSNRKFFRFGTVIQVS